MKVDEPTKIAGRMKILPCVLILALVLSLSVTAHSELAKADEETPLTYTLTWRNSSTHRIGGQIWATDPVRRCMKDLTGLSSLRREPCNESGDKVNVIMNSLSPCELESDVSCIALVETQNESQNWIPAKFISEIRRPEYKWNSSVEDDISVSFVGGIYLTSQGELLAVKAVSCKFCNDPATSVEVLSVSRESVDWKTSGDYKKCVSDSVWVGVAECFVQQPVPKRIRATLNLRWNPSGWIHTQIEDASIKIAQVGGRSFITVEGMSARIPEYSLTLSSDDSNDKITFCDLRSTLEQNGSDPLGFCGNARQVNGNILHNVDTLGKNSGLGDPVRSYSRLVELRPDANRASSENVTWRFSISPVKMPVGKCKNDGFVGSVGGNAMAIDSTIPIWSTKDSTLNFAVTSPHYTSTGDVATGVYELQIREDIAKCLWGVNVTPKNTQFSIIDENGVSKTAVAVVSVQDGMVKFRATGFTYSMARFKIGLIKETKKRFFCVKGKTRVALRPSAKRCPIGWSKL